MRFHLFLLGLALPFLGSAQGTTDDYKRAFSLYDRFNASHVTGWAQDVRWTSDTSFVFTTRTTDGKPQHSQGILGPDGQARIETAPPHTNEQRGNRGQRGENRREDTSTKQGPQLLRNHWMIQDEERHGQRVFSPDSSMVAYIFDDNVFVSKPNGSNPRQLSFDGTLAAYYSAYLQWSPDGRYLCTCRIQPVAQKRYVYYVESSPRTQTQPILHQQEYAKPGDERMQRTPCIFEVATGRAVVPGNTLFANQYDLWGPEWSQDSKSVIFEYNQRGHQVFRVLQLDAQTAEVRTIIEEKSNTFVNYSRHYRHNLDEGRQMLWMSERDNYNHLYLYDVAKARLIRQVTKGKWVVRHVLHVDEEQGQIYFTASGLDSQMNGILDSQSTQGEDPYQIRYYRIGIDGKGLTCLTPENASHQAQFNRDYTYLVDTYSRPDLPPVTVLRSTQDPSKTQAIATADISQLTSQGWVMPEVFAAPGRDGKTPMWGIIQRPTNFDPSHKYPVIEYIYAGPGDAYVPKTFQSYNWNTTSLAELGFIVVQLDAMGTSYRGKDFEDVCYKNLKDAGFPDRMAWIRAAAARYPYMDADNVGIYGCSAGGQESTTAVLLHGDFYKAAYSACGCHDNRMDKIWWNEQWMGYPVDSSYVQCSNVYNAHLLQRPLMLVVGELDDNVDPASTMQVADALIRAGKDFELVVIPGAHHTMGETFGEHKRYDFFVRNLLHVTPPLWAEVKK